MPSEQGGIMRVIATALAVVVTAAGLAAAPEAQAVAPASATVMAPAAVKYKFKNCTALRKVYKHGVGRSNARDHTSGTPVTNFKHSTKLYKKVVGYHSDLDRDKDGIACEKR